MALTAFMAPRFSPRFKENNNVTNIFHSLWELRRVQNVIIVSVGAGLFSRDQRFHVAVGPQ